MLSSTSSWAKTMSHSIRSCSPPRYLARAKIGPC
uniref:Uncharacterized protein n=1 Tax=Arundo donax TaxID=35708 RepID=A0A0A8Z8Z4_ARUDO